MLRNIAGRELDGSCYNLTIGKTVIPFMTISYGDSVKPEWIYSSGSQMPDAQTPGQYTPAEGKIKVRGTIFRTVIMKGLPKVGAANVYFTGVVNFQHPDLGKDSDALYDLRLLGPPGVSLEAGGKANEVEITMSYRYIGWTSQRKQWGNPNGSGYVGAVSL